MSPFITFRDTDSVGELKYYILQRDFPHYVASIEDRKPESALMVHPILGYSLWLVFAGSLRGNMIPGYNNVKQEIESVMLNMSNWFYQYRVLADPKKYKKYVILPPQ